MSRGRCRTSAPLNPATAFAPYRRRRKKQTRRGRRTNRKGPPSDEGGPEEPGATNLEVQRQRNLQQPWRDDALRREPGGVRPADRRDRIVVEDVEQVHTQRRPGIGDANDLP